MKVYEIVTERIVKELESGVVPWRKPWSCADAPMNYKTKKAYRGINVLLLSMTKFQSPYWLGFQQVNELKGAVKAGEKGTMIVYWNMITHETDEGIESYPLLKYLKVFNIEQTTLELPATELPPIKPIEQCETIVKNMPNAPDIYFDSNQAYYQPSTDQIHLPKMNNFNSMEEFYSTQFHEIIHATGHESRLNRKTVTECSYFGSESYSREELVAELGASYLCGTAGIINSTIDNSASYINGWLSKLKNDTRLIVTASATAQKAVEYILNIKPEEA